MTTAHGKPQKRALFFRLHFSLLTPRFLHRILRRVFTRFPRGKKYVRHILKQVGHILKYKAHIFSLLPCGCNALKKSFHFPAQKSCFVCLHFCMSLGVSHPAATMRKNTHPQLRFFMPHSGTGNKRPAAGEISCGGAMDVVFYSQERRQWSVIIGSNAKLLTLSSPGSPSTYQLTCMLRNTESTAEGSSVREGCHFVQNSGRPKR